MTQPIPSIDQMPRQSVRAVFSDFDHTVSEHDGSIASRTVAAIEKLKSQRYSVVLVSGCSAGTADSLLRLLPVDAVVFENGAGIFSRREGKIHTDWLVETGKREAHRMELEQMWQRIHSAVPHARLARGHAFRLFDYAVDYQEEQPPLSLADVEKIILILKQNPQISFRQSSIHVNYWIGNHSKRTACEWWMSKHPEITVDNSIYCGDSPNDEPMFEIFPRSVGVLNVTPFLEGMFFKPRFIANSPYGAGFCEVVNHLLTP